jgi:hypothetical protein
MGQPKQPIPDSGLGRVDLLFSLLTRLELNTPDDLRPHLDLLHGDLEQQVLAADYLRDATSGLPR